MLAERRPGEVCLVQLPEPAVLREYALLADGHRGVVVGPRGDFAWGCVPGWASDPVFSALLGGEGWWTVAPRERHVWGGYYEDGSLIWRNRWVGDEAIVECREALAYPGLEDRVVLLRRLVGLDGRAAVDVRLQLRRSFGRRRLTRLRRHDDGSWTGRLGELYLRWSGLRGSRYDEKTGTFTAVVTVEPTQQVDQVLELSTTPLRDRPRSDELWEATADAWRAAVPPLANAVAERDARHACAVLRGLTGPSGAMVAAVTTSLPERAGGGRDYDYRYAWLRDQCYAGEAAAAAGLDALLDDALRFVGDRVLADGPKLRPAYQVDAAPVPPQQEVSLPGYPGSPAVVVGNRAGSQFQLDVFGEVLLLCASAAERDRLDAQGWLVAATAADAIESRWQEADAGIWETEPRHYTHSRLVCAAGLRRIGAVGPPGAQTNRWTALADRLLAEASATSLHPSGRWRRAVDDDRCDASLLLAQIRGLLPPDDPRSVATLRTVTDDLTKDGYVFRYDVEGGPLGVAEGAFLLCGYWLSQAHAQAGGPVVARAFFERTRAACGPAGLFTEEYDVTQRQLRGNFPQAFVHAAMLETAVRLAD
jgi:GH15 family glucan-1,4-alpha-glucosidase